MAAGIIAPRDEQNAKAILGTNNTDPTKPVLIFANPDTNALFVQTPIENILSQTSEAYVASLIIKTGPGKLKGMTGYNSKGSPQFIQLHDATSLPVDTAIPEVIFTVSGVSNFSIDFGVIGRSFTMGIIVCNSSTGPTKTIGSADCFFDAQYV